MQLKEVMKGDVTSENMVLWKKKNRTFQTGVAFLKKNTSFTEKGNIRSLPKGT